jgi:hypothetical protein
MPARDSFISTDSTTTYASSFSYPSASSSAESQQFDDPIPDHHLPHPNIPIVYENDMQQSMPRREGRNAYIDARGSDTREHHHHQVDTPPRQAHKQSGHVRDMIDRLNPNSSTPTRPKATSTPEVRVDPSRITQRTSQAQLRQKASSSHLSAGSAPSSRRPSPSPAGSPTKQQALPPVSRKPKPADTETTPKQQNRPAAVHALSEPMISLANQLDVRTGTSIVAKPRRLEASGGHLRPPPAGAAPASPARSDTTLAEEWDAELRRNPKSAQIAASYVPDDRDAQRASRPQAERDDWERMGAWDSGKQEGREAEDRARREQGRPVGESLTHF